MNLGSVPVALLPGPTVVLGKGTLEQAEDPAEIAGWLALGRWPRRRCGLDRTG